MRFGTPVTRRVHALLLSSTARGDEVKDCIFTLCLILSIFGVSSRFFDHLVEGAGEPSRRGKSKTRLTEGSGPSVTGK